MDTISSKLIYFVKGDGVLVLPYKEIDGPLELERFKRRFW